MESFVSRRDHIIASAIDIISESGIEALSTKMLAMKENMSESSLYKYFGGIDEVLVEVVDQFVQFDNRIKNTVEAKDISNIDKMKEYFDTYATYYSNYTEITALLLNYESLLHHYNVREKIAGTISLKNETIEGLVKKAIEEGELVDYYEPKELTMLLFGIVYSVILNRRVIYHEKRMKDELNDLLGKTLDGLRRSEV